MNYLHIDVSGTRFVRDDLQGLTPIFISELLEIKIEARLFVNGKLGRSATITLQARYHGQADQALREELLASQYADFHYHHDDQGEGRGGGTDWIVETEDPAEILKWLGIDLAAIIKTHRHDQPLRLTHSPANPGA